MPRSDRQPTSPLSAASMRILALLGTGLLTGACAGGGLNATQELASLTAPAAAEEQAAVPRSELEKATDYWGKEFAKNPRNLEAALAFSKNLKAMGQKGQAMSVLQQASLFHSTDRKLASEYGRLALEFDQLKVAKQLLEAADDPSAPDWRVISARGTVLAKEGRYRDAIPYYERALSLAQNQPSVLNNLALAYTMNGEAEKAEGLLRQAAGSEASNSKVRQNLALVLGLQGKYDESKRVASQDLPSDSAASNAEYMRKLVRLDPKTDGAIIQPAVEVAAPASVPSKAVKQLKPAASDVAAGTSEWSTKVAVSQAPAAAAQPAAAAGPLFKPSAR